jgi:hypothetical protein
VRDAVAPVMLAGALLAAGAGAQDNAGADHGIVMRCVARTVVYRWPAQAGTWSAPSPRCRVAGRPTKSVQAAAQARPIGAAAGLAVTAAVSSPWVIPYETQRQRDLAARSIVQEELTAAETRLAELRALGPARAAAVHAELLQREQERAALRRELMRLP